MTGRTGRKGKILLMTILFCCRILADSVENDSIRYTTLGEVIILEKLPVSTGSEISALKMDRMDLPRVSQALEWIPGITLSEASSRGESLLFLRGFDQTRIPVFMDGIPVSVPFDGLIDLGRIQTSSISKIQVSKGISSLLLGGNTMGGAVNIISTTPAKRFEFGVKASTLWNTAASLGSRHDKWYVQLDGSWLHRNDFRLPSGYTPVSGLQEGDIRHHSRTTDYQFNGKFGFTPKDGDEYMVGYSRITADKYVPPYLGTNGMPRFWRYKDWDKEQIHFFSRTAIHPDWSFESRLFYDRYYNLLKAYDNKEYNSQQSKSAFNSYYDDYSAGARFILAWDGIQNHTLKLGTNYKRDVHRSHDDLDPVATQDEYTASVALEDTWEANSRLSFLAGAGFFYHKGNKAEMYEPLPGSKNYGIVSYPTSSDQDINYQFAVDYKHNSNHSFRFSFSRNARFASLKDRYSYKRGRAIPNPDLKTERSFNFDITYNGNYNNLRWYASAYYMFLSNTIQEITGVVESDPLIWQLQNKGKAHHRGVEAGLSYHYNWIKAEANYTFINRTNKSDTKVSFTGVPDHKWNAMLEVSLWHRLVLIAHMTAVTSTTVSSNGDLSIPGYALFHSSIGKRFNRIEAKLGVKNLFDKLYYLSEGYPMEGRLFYASLSYTFNSQ